MGKERYKYMTWMNVRNYDRSINKIFLALGKKDTEKGNIEPFTPGIMQQLEIIELPKLMSVEECDEWTKKTFNKRNVDS